MTDDAYKEDEVDIEPYEGDPDVDRSQTIDGGAQDDGSDPEDEEESDA